MKLFAAILCVLGVAAGAWGDEAAQLKRLQEEARKQQDQWLSRVKELPGTHAMADVCQVAQENGKLVFKSNLNTKEVGQRRVKIEGVGGATILSMIRDQGAKGNLVHFSLRNINCADTEAVQIDTSFIWTRGHFSVSRSIRLPNGGYRGVSLSQSDQLAAEDGRTFASVQFSVNMSGPGGEPVSFYVQAEDFRSLRRQRTADVEKYLRPLLRELRLEAVMAIDPVLAWQVFADEWKPDAALAEKLQAILAKLDADDFAQREAAMKQLQATGRPGALVVYHADRSKLTAQQNMMLDTFMAPMTLLSAGEASRLRRDRDFLLDCLYSDDLAIRQTALAKLRKLAGAELAFDPSADAAARAESIDRIRRELTQASATRPSTGPARQRAIEKKRSAMDWGSP